MALGEFLADESLGVSSWADEMEDMPTVPSENRGSSGYGPRRDFGGTQSNDRYSQYSRADREDRPFREQLPVPDKPPYTAHIGNLSFDVTESEISQFFASCDVCSVRLVRDREQDRPKGFGYVEFSTKEGLLAALDLNGAQVAGRNVRISVAEPPKDRPDDRTTGEWRRTGPLPPLEPTRRASGYERHGDRGDREESGRRQSSFDQGDGKIRDFGNWERKGPLSPLAVTSPSGSEIGRRLGDRRRSPAPSVDGERPQIERQPTAAEKDNEWRRGARPDPPHRSTPASPVLAQIRPKLELKKRSELPIETGTPTPGTDKPNPFGAARPIDTTQREREVEEKRAAASAARKAKEEKSREGKKASHTSSETDEKMSEAKPPVTGKNFDTMRRVSTSTVEGGLSADVERSTKDKLQERTKSEKPDRPTLRPSESWRARGPRDQPKPAETDGWSTVSSKRGGRGGSGSGGGKPVSAS